MWVKAEFEPQSIFPKFCFKSRARFAPAPSHRRPISGCPRRLFTRFATRAIKRVSFGHCVTSRLWKVRKLFLTGLLRRSGALAILTLLSPIGI
jgi:hypothetical protein